MIGWSWVLLSGSWVSKAGTLGAMTAFGLGGLAVVLIGLTYAELAAAMPKAGGEHVYSLRALGAGASFVCTWALIMAYITVPVFESVAIGVGLEYLFPGIKRVFLWRVAESDVYLSAVAIGAAAALIMTAINVLGIKMAAIVQTVVTFCFFVVGALFITGSLFTGEFSDAAPFWVDGAPGALGVLIMVPMMLVGFDVIPQSAEEIDLPPAAIGKLLVVSVIMAVAWYCLIILGVGLSLSPEQAANSSMATADANAVVWGHPVAGKLLVVAGIGAILTSWNAFIIGGSRALYALARSGMIPRALGDLHPRYNTPHRAVILIGVLSMVSPLLGRKILVWLIDAGGFAVIIAYAMVAWSFLVLRRKEPGLERPFRVRHGQLVGYLALIMSIAIGMVYLPFSPASLVWPYEWIMVLAWALIGAVFYALRDRKHSAATPPAEVAPTVESSP